MMRKLCWRYTRSSRMRFSAAAMPLRVAAATGILAQEVEHGCECAEEVVPMDMKF
jgi:hypothetical protein